MKNSSTADRYIFLPGMGATSEMYVDPWRELPNSIFIEWPHHFQGTTITELAQTLIEQYDITPQDTVIGSSLGGIVACEISNLISLKRVILLGSAQHKEEIALPLQLLHPLAQIIPWTLLCRLAGRFSYLLIAMLSKISPSFMRTTCKAIFTWKGDQNRSPILRIHGKRDFVIPHPRHVDLTLNAGHLITMTHAQECLAEIQKS